MYLLETCEAVPGAALSMDFISPTDRDLCPGETTHQRRQVGEVAPQMASRDPRLLIFTLLCNRSCSVCVDWTW